MKFQLNKLELVCRRSIEEILFTDVNYFYGEIGAGKSTIARLIDYCLGGDLVMTPALQSEFIEVSLFIEVEGVASTLIRERESNKILAVWGSSTEQEQAVLPARRSNGVVIPGTQVEVISDFLFYLAGMRPPKVRRSRTKEESELERLSFRDLYIFCYLDQDNIDSSFFYLDRDAEYFRRLKSLNVLRFVLGYQQERVAELEVKLEETRNKRIQAEQGAGVLGQTLIEAGLNSELEVRGLIEKIESDANRIKVDLGQARAKLTAYREHASDQLRERAQLLVGELEAVDDATAQIEDNLRGDQRHLNEILALSTKVQRVTSARALLNGVEFERCPRCTQPLPHRPDGCCHVCAQPDPQPEEIFGEVESTRRDFRARVEELTSIIKRQESQLSSLRRRRSSLTENKAQVDRELNQVLKNYDPVELSNIVRLERELAEKQQGAKYYDKLLGFFSKVGQLSAVAEKTLLEERSLRKELKEARDAAEKDTANVKLLAELFLDCLVRAKLPGFSVDDMVKIEPPYYLPQVITQAGDIATVSFETLGSGGVKTLFKACFAIAIHRLASRVGANLPSLLVIDSPMKNISERENRPQFEGFHSMLYEIAQGELSGVQIVLIDKEFCPPPHNFKRDVFERHMQVDSEEFPPLIGYYRGGRGDVAAAPEEGE